MKTINSMFALLFLLLPFTIKLKLAIAGGVRDTDGSMLENGGDYYILPSFDEDGGGVTITCIGVTYPLAIVQSSSQNNTLGLPVSISNTQGTMIILTDEIVNIKFTNIPHYGNFSTWVLVMDELAKVWYVGIGNESDYPGHQIKVGTFQIKDYNSEYKLVFCADGNTSSCDDVGIYVDGNKNRRLALFGEGFAVKFMNADKYLVAFD